MRFMNPELDIEEVRVFSSFLAAVMKLDPETRPTAAELLKHPWITASNK